MDFKAWFVMIGRGFACGLSSALAVNLLCYHKFVQENENPNYCYLRWEPCNHDYRTINHTIHHQTDFFYLVSKFCRFQGTAGAREMWGLGSHSNTAGWGIPVRTPAQRLFNNLPSLKTSPTVAQALCEPEKVFLPTWTKLIQALWRLQSLEKE